MPFKITPSPRVIIDTTDVVDGELLELTLEDDTKLFVSFVGQTPESWSSDHFVLDRRWLPLDLIKTVDEIALLLLRVKQYEREFARREDISLTPLEFLRTELMRSLRIDFSEDGSTASGMPDVGHTFKVSFREPGSRDSFRLGWRESWPAVPVRIKSIVEGSEYEAGAYTALHASRETA